MKMHLKYLRKELVDSFAADDLHVKSEIRVGWNSWLFSASIGESGWAHDIGLVSYL